MGRLACAWTFVISCFHPGKPAFHRTKLSLDAFRPAKWPFTGWNGTLVSSIRQEPRSTGREDIKTSSSKSLWQPMCHRKRILASPCQGESKKGSLWQATLNRVRSTPSSLPKWIGGTPRAKQKAQSRTRPCAILQISVYKKQSNLMLWNKNKPMSRFRSVRLAPNYLSNIF